MHLGLPPEQPSDETGRDRRSRDIVIGVRAWSVIVPVLALLALPSCGGSGEEAASTPCVVPVAEMSEILGSEHVVIAAPQQDDVRCIYAIDGQALVSVSVMTQEQFQAERDRFENSGVKLPKLVTAEGFDGEANIDPRYNSLNVTAGDQIVSIEIVGAEPSDPEEQLSLEKDVARAALERV